MVEHVYRRYYSIPSKTSSSHLPATARNRTYLIPSPDDRRTVQGYTVDAWKEAWSFGSFLKGTPTHVIFMGVGVFVYMPFCWYLA
jgi:hypothetical protein